MKPKIYTDNGAALGLRTRIFRPCADGHGFEWQYAVDHASGCRRWFFFGAGGPNATIETMRQSVAGLSEWNDERVYEAPEPK